MAKSTRLEIKRNGVLFSMGKAFLYWGFRVMEYWSVANTLKYERRK
jgi:hypothetical protein